MTSAVDDVTTTYTDYLLLLWRPNEIWHGDQHWQEFDGNCLLNKAFVKVKVYQIL